MKQGNMIEELEKYYTKYITMKFVTLTAFPPSSFFLEKSAGGEKCGIQNQKGP